MSHITYLQLISWRFGPPKTCSRIARAQGVGVINVSILAFNRCPGYIKKGIQTCRSNRLAQHPIP